MSCSRVGERSSDLCNVIGIFKCLISSYVGSKCFLRYVPFGFFSVGVCEGRKKWLFTMVMVSWNTIGVVKLQELSICARFLVSGMSLNLRLPKIIVHPFHIIISNQIKQYLLYFAPFVSVNPKPTYLWKVFPASTTYLSLSHLREL